MTSEQTFVQNVFSSDRIVVETDRFHPGVLQRTLGVRAQRTWVGPGSMG